MKYTHAICYLSVGNLPKGKAEDYSKGILQNLQEWMKDVKWLMIPRREGETYIEFIPEE